MYYAHLNLFRDNPWQPRQRMDPQKLQDLATKIYSLKTARGESKGLLQLPAARLVNADNEPVALALVNHLIPTRGELTKFLKEQKFHLQIAWGHRRRQAFGLLVDGFFVPGPEGMPGSMIADPDYETMPFELVEFNDQEMFEMAITENGDRDDLTVIDVARAMAIYRDQFNKSSREIGALFGGMSDSAVRNKMRLLDLPAPMLEKLEKGELTEGTARRLLAVRNILTGEKADSLASELATGGFDNPTAVDNKIKDTLQRSSKKMWPPYSSETDMSVPRGGTGLWPLDWQMPAREKKAVKFSDFEYLYTGPQEFTWPAQPFPQMPQSEEKWDVKRVFEKARVQWGEGYMKQHLTEMGAQQVFEAVQQLIEPPPCTQCPFYVKVAGDHFCGVEACWKNKKAAWFKAELERVSTETGIPVYDRKTDGKDYEALESYHTSDKWQKWYDEKNKHLRLKFKYADWRPHLVTGSHVVQLVSVRPEIRKKNEREQEKSAARDQYYEERNRQWEKERENRERSDRFIVEIAAPAFAGALGSITNIGLLKLLARAINSHAQANGLDENTPRKQREQNYRVFVMGLCLREMGHNDKTQGPLHVSGVLQGRAKEFAVTLPEDWEALARKYAGEPEPEIVSVETSNEALLTVEDPPILETAEHPDDWLKN